MERNVKTGMYVRNGVEETFTFYTNLRAIDKLSFINFVTNIVVSDNYYPIIKNMLFDFEIIDLMTDIDVSHIKDSTDAISAIEDFLNETDIVTIVKENIDDGLIEELNYAIDANIEYKTGIHKSLIEESLANLLNTIETKITDVDTEEIMNIVNTISDVSGELTADNIIKAYANSDIFAKNYEQLVSDRENRNTMIDAIKEEIKLNSNE